MYNNVCALYSSSFSFCRYFVCKVERFFLKTRCRWLSFASPGHVTAAILVYHAGACLRENSCSFWENRSPVSSKITVCWIVPGLYYHGPLHIFYSESLQDRKIENSAATAIGEYSRWWRGCVHIRIYPEISYNFYDIIAMGLLLLFDNVSQGFPTH